MAAVNTADGSHKIVEIRDVGEVSCALPFKRTVNRRRDGLARTYTHGDAYLMKLSAILSSPILLITLFLLSTSQLHAQSSLALSSGTVLPGGTTVLDLSLSSLISNQP